MTWVRRLLIVLASLLALFLLYLGVWAAFIGPEAMWRVFTKGTTTVWDHLEYPGRPTVASPAPRPWPQAKVAEPTVAVDGVATPIGSVLAANEGLAMVIVHDGAVVYEWYAPGHDPATPSMLFSVTKSITSLLVGAAIDDGLIGSVDDPITMYIEELRVGGFDTVTIADALAMDTDADYVEDDNPFGIHVEFNYTADLERDIIGLRVRDEPHSEFTYKSGDNAILGLILHRVLAPESITSYLQHRFLNPLGVEHPGMWSTDDTDGLERTWCCLALTASDLARLGRLVLDAGAVDGTQVVRPEWLAASFTPAYTAAEWPAGYAGAVVTNYGYQWWLAADGVATALGKDGQYLYVDPSRDVVIVRTGTSFGDVGWLDLLTEIAAQFEPAG